MDSYKEPLKALARPYRKAVLKALLVLTMLGGALFAMLNPVSYTHLTLPTKA